MANQMEQQNTLMIAAALDPLVKQELQIAEIPCHILPGETHVAIVVNPRPSVVHSLYRCQMKWWEGVVQIDADGTVRGVGVTKLASALSSPSGAAKRLAKKAQAFRV